MRLSFRQGIVRFQTDVMQTPTFLQKAAGAGNFVDLYVSPDPTIISFAHKSANYIIEEVKSVSRAWGPFTSSTTQYLFWDIDLLTGGLTRGATSQPPTYSATPPTTPVNDQHWFDPAEAQMRVWNGKKWIEKVRVFAAALINGATIKPMQIGSQAGIHGSFEGGNLVLDSYNKPLRQSDGTFVTTATNMLIVNNSAKKVQFETEMMAGMAVEPIPKYSLVQVLPNRRLKLAKSSNPMSRVTGLVTEDLYENEVGTIIPAGLVQYDGWSFSASEIGRPVFCSPTGGVTTNPPQAGVIQAIGSVYDTDAIFIDIKIPVILDDIWSTGFNEPSGSEPIASFVASVSSGPSPLTVTFTSTSAGDITGYEWDLGNDGVVDGTAATITRIYTTPGKYDVKLTAVNDFGRNSVIKSEVIEVFDPLPVETNTNLGIKLTGPAQALRSTTITVGISVANNGSLTATNVERIIKIPDVRGQKVIPSNLPAGATTGYASGITTIELPKIGLLASGLTYGPVNFSLTVPPRAGTMTISASTKSPEIDSELGDNSTTLVVEVRA